MKDARLRVPVADDYVVALGRAAYVFATLEWNAVWCSERLDPGFIFKLGKKTAGGIAKALVKYVEKHDDEDIRKACLDPVREFKRLVEVRNDILHGNPGTASDDAQRLFRNGVAWTVEMIDDAADEFASCSGRLNTLLYGVLKRS